MSSWFRTSLPPGTFLLGALLFTSPLLLAQSETPEQAKDRNCRGNLKKLGMALGEQ